MRVTVFVQLKKSNARAGGVYPLYVRCTLSVQRFEVATGFTAHPDSWDEAKQVVKGRTEEVKIVNNRLDKIKTKIQDIFNQLESIGEPFDVLKLKKDFWVTERRKACLKSLILF